MTDLVVSLIRTYVPLAVGTLVAWLATKGINLDVDAATGLTAFLSAVFTGVYYLAARLLEQRWPEFGALLGKAKKPEYK
jgi:hypothetical protein